MQDSNRSNRLLFVALLLCLSFALGWAQGQLWLPANQKHREPEIRVEGTIDSVEQIKLLNDQLHAAGHDVAIQRQALLDLQAQFDAERGQLELRITELEQALQTSKPVTPQTDNPTRQDAEQQLATMLTALELRNQQLAAALQEVERLQNIIAAMQLESSR
jgi:hypothetical protein